MLCTGLDGNFNLHGNCMGIGEDSDVSEQIQKSPKSAPITAAL